MTAYTYITWSFQTLLLGGYYQLVNNNFVSLLKIRCFILKKDSEVPKYPEIFLILRDTHNKLFLFQLASHIKIFFDT